MKYLKTLLIVFLFFSNLVHAQQPYWLDEKVSEENRLPMHSSFFVYANQKEAVVDNWQTSANYLSLDGTWKFKWVEKPADLPVNFYREGFDDSAWDNFKIPATWEVNGYGYPIYVNIGYEFENIMKPNPPIVPPSYDPTGVYRKEITISKYLHDQQTILHIGSAKSNISVWVNGRYAGYGEDSI